MEEEEGPSDGSRNAPKRSGSRSQQPGDEVCSILVLSTGSPIPQSIAQQRAMKIV